MRGLWTQVNVNLYKGTSPSPEIPEGRGIRKGDVLHQHENREMAFRYHSNEQPGSLVVVVVELNDLTMVCHLAIPLV